MSAELNRLIAMGGTQNRSPVQRYMETRAQIGQERQNKLAMESTRQSMDIQRQKMAAQQQKQQAEKMKVWGTKMAPFMREVSLRPEAERQAHWGTLVPSILEMGVESNVPLNETDLELWNQQKANTIMDMNPIEAPKRMSRLEGSETIYEDWDSRLGRFQEKSRGISTQITAKPGDLTKPAVTSLQKQLTKNLLSKDKITTGVNFIMENQNLFDLGSRVSAGAGNLMEYVGVDAPEYLKKEVRGMTNLNTYTLNIANEIRKESTGASASYKELKNYVYPLVSVATDGKTRAILRAQALTQFNELTTVRLNKLLNDGYKTVSKQGDKIMRVKSPEGKIVAVDKSFPLSSIPSYNKRKGQLLSEMAQGKSPSDFSEQQRIDMFNEVQSAMTLEGYNTDVSRTGWSQ